MFGPLGVPELLFILVLALLIFGPRKLPEIGRTLGKGMAEFRKASNELKRSLNTEVIREEIRQNDPRRVLRDAVDGTGDAEPSGKSARPAGGKPAPPEGSVSRGDASGAPSGDEGATSAEPEPPAAADTIPSSST